MREKGCASWDRAQGHMGRSGECFGTIQVIQTVKFLLMKLFMNRLMRKLLKKEVKQMETDDQAIQIILIGLPEDIYAAIDSCEAAQEI
nr:hypothetical protein [Tanacetum cinerariifolium]